MATVERKPWVGRQVFIFFQLYVLEVNIGLTVATEPRAGGEINSAKSLKTCTGMQKKGYSWQCDYLNSTTVTSFNLKTSNI